MQARGRPIHVPGLPCIHVHIGTLHIGTLHIGILRRKLGAAEEEGGDGPHTIAPCHGAALPRRPRRPPRPERAPAGQKAPEELPGGADPRGEPVLRTAGRGPSSAESGLSRAAEGRPRMPERRPDPVLGHPLTEALQGLLDGGATRHGYQTARKPPFERYEPWAKGCLWVCMGRACGRPAGRLGFQAGMYELRP